MSQSTHPQTPKTPIIIPCIVILHPQADIDISDRSRGGAVSAKGQFTTDGLGESFKSIPAFGISFLFIENEGMATVGVADVSNSQWTWGWDQGLFEECGNTSVRINQKTL